MGGKPCHPTYKLRLCVPQTGIEPVRTLRPTGFSYHYSFHYCRPFGACVAWSGLYLHRIITDLDAHRQVSTPSSYEAWLGITILKASPNLMGSTLKVSYEALKFLLLSPARLPVPPPGQFIQRTKTKTAVKAWELSHPKIVIQTFLSFTVFCDYKDTMIFSIFKEKSYIFNDYVLLWLKIDQSPTIQHRMNPDIFLPDHHHHC